MYKKTIYLTAKHGNNALSFEKRNNPKLFVPSLKKISSSDEIELLDSYEGRITFEDYDFDDTLQTCYGLRNLYELDWKGKPLYLVDNHNHVFYFWYLARSQRIISDNALLYHIDEHADTRDPGEYLMKPDSEDLKKIFEFTNFTLNVGNYIVPAQKEGLVGEVVQIRGEEALKEFLQTPLSNFPLPGERASCNLKSGLLSPSRRESGERGVVREQSIILNLDLDFFEPELDFIDYDLKKQVILDIARKADLITVCTSPFFIDQERAIKVFRDIFDK